MLICVHDNLTCNQSDELLVTTHRQPDSNACTPVLTEVMDSLPHWVLMALSAQTCYCVPITPKTLLVLDFALQHTAISKFHAARRTLETVHLLSPGRCSGTDFLKKSGQTTHYRVSSLSLRHTISDSNHL